MPISILCSVSKALEHIAVDQVKKYLKISALLDSYQFAYRRDFTQTALFKIMDDIRHIVDMKKAIAMVVFFDFIRVFDIIHYTLINKLSNIGFSSSALHYAYFMHNL